MNYKVLISLLLVFGFYQCRTKSTTYTKSKIYNGKTLISSSYKSYDYLIKNNSNDTQSVPKGGKFNFLIVSENKINANTKYYTYTLKDSSGRIITNKTGISSSAKKSSDNFLWSNNDSLEIHKNLAFPITLLLYQTRTEEKDTITITSSMLFNYITY